MAEQKEHQVTNAELIYSVLSMGFLGVLVGALWGYQDLDINLREAQIEYEKNGSAEELISLEHDVAQHWINFSILGGGVGALIGLVNVFGINTARNASTQRQCPHACSHHHPV